MRSIHPNVSTKLTNATQVHMLPSEALVNTECSLEKAIPCKVSGWRAYGQASVGFVLLPIAPNVSCSSVDALHTLRGINFRRLPLSPAVS